MGQWSIVMTIVTIGQKIRRVSLTVFIFKGRNKDQVSAKQKVYSRHTCRC
jgi:hypothetical protein